MTMYRYRSDKLTINCSISRSKSTFGRSGIIWATILNPESFENWKLHAEKEQNDQ